MIRLGICNELFEGWEFGEVCRKVKALGFDGLEIAPYTLAPLIDEVSPRRLREYRAMIEDTGLTTIGLHGLLAKTKGFSLTAPNRERRERICTRERPCGAQHSIHAEDARLLHARQLLKDIRFRVHLVDG